MNSNNSAESDVQLDTVRVAKRRIKKTQLLVIAVLGTPIVLAALEFVTAPPRRVSVPYGHLIYMDADKPSDRTANLRGMYSANPSGMSQLMIHEQEPPDVDAGPRQWIEQPAVSPDGTQIAYVRENIVIAEDKHSTSFDIFVLPLQQPHAVAHQIAALGTTAKQFAGLAWSPDCKSITYMEDSIVTTVPVVGEAQAATRTLPPTIHAVPLPEVSWSDYPQIGLNNRLLFLLHPSGTLATDDGPTSLTGIQCFAVSHSGSQFAYVTSRAPKSLVIAEVAALQTVRTLPVTWGMSFLGHRKITSIGWSPTDQDLAFTVSKMPFPEDELLVINLKTGKESLLPERVAKSSWAWAP